jgi:hypothetical protein
MGLGWRVEWGFGLWFFHLLLYPTIKYGLSIYGSLKTIQVKGKKKPGTGGLCPTQADCVRPSRVPTSWKEIRNFFFDVGWLLFIWAMLEYTPCAIYLCFETHRKDNFSMERQNQEVSQNFTESKVPPQLHWENSTL